jgi:hypothetical protein
MMKLNGNQNPKDAILNGEADNRGDVVIILARIANSFLLLRGSLCTTISEFLDMDDEMTEIITISLNLNALTNLLRSLYELKKDRRCFMLDEAESDEVIEELMSLCCETEQELDKITRIHNSNVQSNKVVEHVDRKILAEFSDSICDIERQVYDLPATLGMLC